jgi:hypothetical protein
MSLCNQHTDSASLFFRSRLKLRLPRLTCCARSKVIRPSCPATEILSNMAQTSGGQNDIFEDLESYPWDEDPEFQVIFSNAMRTETGSTVISLPRTVPHHANKGTRAVYLRSLVNFLKTPRSLNLHCARGASTMRGNLRQVPSTSTDTKLTAQLIMPSQASSPTTKLQPL